MVRPDGSVTARPETRAFHDAKYAVNTAMQAAARDWRAAMDLPH